MKFKHGLKNGQFLKGFVHGFCLIIELSLIALFTEIMSAKSFVDILNGN